MFSRSVHILRPLLSPTLGTPACAPRAPSLLSSLLPSSNRPSLPRAHHTTSSNSHRPLPFRLPPRRPNLSTSITASSIPTISFPIHRYVIFQSRSLQFRIPPPPSSRYSYNRFQSRPQNIFHLWKSSQTFRRGVFITFGGAIVFYFYNIETVPVSGRRRFNIISPQREAALAKSMYTATIQQFHGRILPESHPMTRMVKRVMGRLISVSGMEDLNWEVFVIADDSMKNAFVIPGGKVFVFSGMFPICQDDDGLAAVLSHEISHTVAHHQSERISQSLLAIIALTLTSLALGYSDGGFGRLLMDLVYLRPGSRRQEAEADYIGLMMMSSACYDPHAAVRMWERMEKAEKGMGAPPQFLSTHPAHRTRIENLQKSLPEALDKQAQSDCHQTMDYAHQFRKAFAAPVW